MRLSPNAYRELHWHQAGEWGFVFNGSLRVALVNEAGQSYVDDINAGDVWFFPPGVPHSIQALDQGSEFLLVFDDVILVRTFKLLKQANSNRDSSLKILPRWLQKCFFVILALSWPRTCRPTSLCWTTSHRINCEFFSASQIFACPCSRRRYIFPGNAAPPDIAKQNTTGPAGPTDQPDTQYTYHWSQQEPLKIPGAGSLKIVDPTTFPASADLSAALVTIHPGAMRELHWHPHSDEWNFFLSGTARITVYQAPASSQTFDYGPGDVGYIPMTSSHYIENTGSEDVVLLEMLKAPQFTDISVAQWLGLTPKQVVKDTLNLPDEVLNNLPKYKPYLISGPTNLTDTNYTKPFGQ